MSKRSLNGQQLIKSIKKRTSQGDGLRKRGSFKKGNGKKKYKGQGK